MKTPKREHWCRRCCGPIDVHLDPSGETEEYSICRVCHSKTISHCGHSWAPYKERARWTRKNREARSKNTIRHLKQTIAELEYDCRERGEAVEELLEQNKQAYLEIEALKSANREIAVWLKELCEQKEPTLLQTRPIDRLVKLYAHKLHRVPYSTYGHDIEGS